MWATVTGGGRRQSSPSTMGTISKRLARGQPAPWRGLEDRLQEAPGEALGDVADILGRALRDDPSAAVASLGAQVDHPVRGLDHVEVVLDHDDGVAVVAQSVQHREQQVDVVEVQAGRRLVEDEERAPRVALGELERKLHALRFAPGKGGRALPELDVAESHLEE